MSDAEDALRYGLMSFEAYTRRRRSDTDVINNALLKMVEERNEVDSEALRREAQKLLLRADKYDSIPKTDEQFNAGQVITFQKEGYSNWKLTFAAVLIVTSDLQKRWYVTGGNERRWYHFWELIEFIGIDNFDSAMVLDMTSGTPLSSSE